MLKGTFLWNIASQKRSFDTATINLSRNQKSCISGKEILLRTFITKRHQKPEWKSLNIFPCVASAAGWWYDIRDTMLNLQIFCCVIFHSPSLIPLWVWGRLRRAGASFGCLCIPAWGMSGPACSKTEPTAQGPHPCWFPVTKTLHFIHSSCIWFLIQYLKRSCAWKNQSNYLHKTISSVTL